LGELRAGKVSFADGRALLGQRRVSGPMSTNDAGRVGAMSGRVLHVEGYEGKVVAVDLATDDVVASADTPEELMVLLHGRNLTHAAIVRVPRADEPLRVGLG